MCHSCAWLPYVGRGNSSYLSRIVHVQAPGCSHHQSRGANAYCLCACPEKEGRKVLLSRDKREFKADALLPTTIPRQSSPQTKDMADVQSPSPSLFPSPSIILHRPPRCVAQPTSSSTHPRPLCRRLPRPRLPMLHPVNYLNPHGFPFNPQILSQSTPPLLLHSLPFDFSLLSFQDALSSSSFSPPSSPPCSQAAWLLS